MHISFSGTRFITSIYPQPHLSCALVDTNKWTPVDQFFLETYVIGILSIPHTLIAKYHILNFFYLIRSSENCLICLLFSFNQSCNSTRILLPIYPHEYILNAVARLRFSNAISSSKAPCLEVFSIFLHLLPVFASINNRWYYLF